MKKIILLYVLLCTTYAFSQQETFEKEVRKISKKIDVITQQEKDSLKIKVKKINNDFEKGIITSQVADASKKEAASLHARNIERRVSEQEQKLQNLVQDKANGRIASSNNVEGFDITIFNKKILHINASDNDGNRKDKWKRKNKRTTTQFVFAFGVNNVLTDNQFSSLNDSEYKFWQSHFYELGFSFKTRFSKEPSKTYFKYGLSFLWNNLRLENNQFHTIESNTTAIESHTQSLSESRLRHVQMIFPMHLEFDFSKNKKHDDGFIKDRTHESIRFGIGGFFGFKLGTRQYLEYTNQEGIEVEKVQKNNFNMNTFNYGLSAYFAYEGIGFYAKYDLNSLFKDTDTKNIYLGVRFDLN